MSYENSLKEISLEKPNLDDSFLQILNKRVSTKEYNNKKDIDNKTLSEILWAAYGINRYDILKRTIPTAYNEQDLEIYVIKKNGVWLYDALNFKLKLINKQNLFPLFMEQDYVADVPLILLYASKNKNVCSSMHAGSSYQNVALYCAKNNLGNVVRGYFEIDKVANELGISSDSIIVSQAVGYMK